MLRRDSSFDFSSPRLPLQPTRSEWEFVNECSCIYMHISIWVYAENLDFFVWTRTKLHTPHNSAFWHMLCMPVTCHNTPSTRCTRFQCVFFYLFLVFKSAFFLQTYLGTWDRISSTCNVFGGLLNLHSMSSQFFMRCLSLLNYMNF